VFDIIELVEYFGHHNALFNQVSFEIIITSSLTASVGCLLTQDIIQNGTKLSVKNKRSDQVKKTTKIKILCFDLPSP